MKHIAVLLYLALIAAVLITPYASESWFGVPLVGAAKFLQEIVLTAISLGVSYQLSKPAAERRARKMWLPFAEVACTSLIAIASSAERMRRIQRGQCRRLEQAIPERTRPSLKPVLAVFDTQCIEASEKLANLRDQAKTAQSAWEVFIRQHCDGSECAEIDSRLRNHESSAYKQMAKETPIPQCEVELKPAPDDQRNGPSNESDCADPAGTVSQTSIGLNPRV